MFEELVNVFQGFLKTLPSIFLFSEVIAAKNVSTSEFEMSLDRLDGRWAVWVSPLGT